MLYHVYMADINGVRCCNMSQFMVKSPGSLDFKACIECMLFYGMFSHDIYSLDFQAEITLQELDLVEIMLFYVSRHVMTSQ